MPSRQPWKSFSKGASIPNRFEGPVAQALFLCAERAHALGGGFASDRFEGKTMSGEKRLGGEVVDESLWRFMMLAHGIRDVHRFDPERVRCVVGLTFGGRILPILLF